MQESLHVVGGKFSPANRKMVSTPTFIPLSSPVLVLVARSRDSGFDVSAFASCRGVKAGT
jgi:hypothetical protein